ncbi:class I SAM-dependent methyltransferase [Psychromonas sp. KJ10-2]|uniref:class I SAM-dependent methyltransferase n=1 Tax=Psychromonas sp. KJ10-2 TaxID=3391822 RepID=UPI0039B4FA8A
MAKKAHFEFIESSSSAGEWKALQGNLEHDWQIKFNNITINLHLTKFKHVGLFPEQRVNWDFIAENLTTGDRFLNLFAYTGVASLVARDQGAEVLHCDSVKQIIKWGKENMESSGLTDVHWVLEDALKFAQREIKRGKKYQGLVMDPPLLVLVRKKNVGKSKINFPNSLKPL